MCCTELCCSICQKACRHLKRKLSKRSRLCQTNIHISWFKLKGSPSVSQICLRLSPRRTTSSGKQEAAVKSRPTFRDYFDKLDFFFLAGFLTNRRPSVAFSRKGVELWGTRGGVPPPVSQCQGVKNVELELVLCQHLSVCLSIRLNHVLSLHQ